jgi:hypothetical protein
VRSRAELFALGALAVAVACGAADPAQAQREPAASQSVPLPAQPRSNTPGLDRAPTADEISEALAKVEADPNLAAVRMMRSLRFKGAAEQRQGPPGWVVWLAGLFEWIGQTARLLVWVAVVLLAGLLGVYVVRLVRRRAAKRAVERFVPPSHVRDLDIRPESLPADVGAAARELWDRGERRAALALLYRGLLSRLAHEHGVPIRDSSTEGDCLDLAERRLSVERMSYAARLIGVWQVGVYGGESPETAEIHSLCKEFGRTLDANVAPEAAP